MKCEICHRNDASCSIHRTVNGADEELFVCKECAARVKGGPEMGVDSDGRLALGDVLHSLGLGIDLKEARNAADGPDAAAEQKIRDGVCPACGMSRKELRATHRLGCPMCFQTFDSDVRTFLCSQVPSSKREGMGPKESYLARQIADLRRKFEKALEKDDFEKAHEIQNEIRKLQNGGVMPEAPKFSDGKRRDGGDNKKGPSHG